MSPRQITNFYIPSLAAAPFSMPTLEALPVGRHGNPNVTHRRHCRNRSCDIESIHRDHDVPPTSVKKDRRRTINCGLARPPLTPAQQEARILPQRVITPRFSPGVQSIWFQSQSEHPDVGVSLADIVDDGAEGLMIAPEERVFQRFGLRHDEIQFSILWPGYGHISWIASIPVNFREGSGHPSGPITRRLLASVVAEHFQAFMINHSYLRFPHPDSRWRIMNDRESGIRFENLRLTRLFGYKDEAGELSSWQAEVLVADDYPTYAY